MKDVLIGVDAGTSVVKSIAFDLEGRQLAVAATPNRYQTRPDGAAFQSMTETWEDAAKTLRELTARDPGLAARVAAVGVTGQGDGTWLVDRDNRPVADAWLWLDGRAGPSVRALRGQPADRARYEATGTGLNVCQQGSQLAHMKATTPEIVAAADAAMHCKDWLYLNLTGVRATDPSEACFTFGDFRRRAYDDGVIATLGLQAERRLLPDILDGVSATHPLTRAAAAETGLLAGTPVSLGYVDVVCTAIGAGILTDGEPARCTIIGSTGMHMRAVRAAEAHLNAEGTGYTMTLPLPGMVAQMQSNMAATLNIDWVLALAADLLADMGHETSKQALIGRIEGWVNAARPGALLFHPYISEAGERGPFVNNRARAGFNGLSFSHRFPDLVRAVIEGLGFAARDCYDAMGRSRAEVRLTGGAGRSRSLRAILAACLDAPVRVSSREEAGAAGAAMIAACAVGAHRSMDEAIARWVTPELGQAEPPDAALAKTYAALFPAYVAARRALEPVWDQLAERDMRRQVAIVGDHFMLPSAFEAKLRAVCGDALDIRAREDNWPDEPMEHGYATAGMEGLKEYFGTADDVVSFIGDAEILVTHLAPMSAAMLARLPNLKMIAVSRGGPVNIDMAAARARGLRVVNTPGRNSSAVAEFALGAILAETRKIRVGHEALRRGEWRGDLYRADTTGRELNEMTVGVIGYGKIGTKVVKLLRAFGARILVHDPYVQLSADDAAAGVTLVGFDELLAQSDVVTMHARVTAETTGMMNAQAFARMKRDAIFVNTARGPLCDYEALYQALKQGEIAGAMLETFGVEPVPPDWPLLQLPNVTLTPHIAGASMRTVTIAAEQAAEEVRRYLKGEGPLNPC